MHVHILSQLVDAVSYFGEVNRFPTDFCGYVYTARLCPGLPWFIWREGLDEIYWRWCWSTKDAVCLAIIETVEADEIAFEELEELLDGGPPQWEEED